MKFLDALRGEQVQRNDMSFQDWINAFQANVLSYPGQWPGYQFTYGKDPAEPIANSFAGYVAGGLQSNGVVFALELKRLQVFSQARFQYQRMRNGRPAELFGNGTLSVLEKPWPGGTTSDMLARMILDADFAGNNWQAPLDDEIVRLRPDWVEIILHPRMLPLGPDGEDVQVGWQQKGIFYYEGGIYSGSKPAVFLAGEYSHFAPFPDPLATYRGMSWLTPVIRELQADTSATKHKLKFFENAATPNVAVSLAKEITPAQFEAFVEKMDARHKGVDHAYETLYTAGGADVTVIGANMQQLDFKVTQGAGETRLAAAAGIHPVIVGLSEGMQGSSLNAGNYTAAKRNTVDTTFRHLWQNAAGSLAPLVPVPDDARLWYDARDIPFLHEDQRDVAQIQAAQASAWRQLVDGGMAPDAATAFIQTNDLGALLGQHSGLYSVQLQPPGPNQEPTGEAVPKAPAADAARSSDVPAADEWDTDPIGDLDEDTEALIYALSRFAPKAARALSGAAFNAAHKRGPDGRFLTMVDRVINALKDHKKSGGKGDPFAGFDREQLRKAAKARGIALKKGEDRDSIAAKLLADLGGSTAKPNSAAAPSRKPAQPSLSGVTTKPGAKWHTGDATTEVHDGGDQLGIVVHSSKTHGFFPFVPSGSKKTPLGNTVRVQPGAGSGYQTEQSAVDAIVRAHTPSKVSGPGLAGLDLAELRIEPQSNFPGSGHLSKTSHEISQNGSEIGTVHDFGYGWEARDAQGRKVTTATAINFGTKSEALAALVAHKGTPAAPKATPKPPPAPAQPATVSHGPEVQAALDVLFGKDPKGNTAARQMVVYGALRRDQFDQLGPLERSTLLGDLSYIMTTSKDPKAQNRALTIFGRLTPPGTPFGHVPAQMGIVPTLAAGPGQTRFPDPDGVKGMLKKAKDAGQSGDGWTRLANGGTGPWGKYGASGLLLRHVDPADGKERFLMVQRGPGISDPGKWQFPGGAIDSKETMAEGATREVVEELGFKYSDFTNAGVHGYHETTVPGAGSWKYTSFAATVPTRLKPDLSTHHARMETADAKWMTADEIRKLDSGGKLLKPLSGGALERNVMSLFPSGKQAPSGAAVPGSGPATKKLPRLSGTPQVAQASAPARPATPHKPSTGKDLIPTKAAQDKLRADVSAVRKTYRGKTADERLAAIGAMQGFDETPTVASKAEMDRLLATGDYIEVWRGVSGKAGKSAAAINEDMRSGSAYYGLGVFGNGYYLATDKAIGQAYSDGSKNSLLRALIPKAARIGKHEDVRAKTKSATSSKSYAYVGRQGMGGGTLHDEGRYAAASGIDGIHISQDQYRRSGGNGHLATGPVYNWVNRSVLIIQEAQ